jgi:hypothetical protein
MAVESWIPLRNHGKDASDDDKFHHRHPTRSRLSQVLLKWRSASQTRRVFWAALIFVGTSLFVLVARKVRRYLRGDVSPAAHALDFLVAGFPKCGTTSLLAALHTHPHVIMDDREYCQVARPIQQDDVNMRQLNRYLTDLKNERKVSSSSNNMKVGIKCPEALKNFRAIHRLSQHSPRSKWVIGLRHPILFVQSFYNYRVLETYIKKKKGASSSADEIPDLHQLWETPGLTWRDFSRDTVRFDLFLSQLGKAGLNATQLRAFSDQDMLAIKPNHFEVFLYTLDQIEDSDLTRKGSFQADLLRFLDLNPELLPIDLGHENKNHATGGLGYPESINICATPYADIRAALMHQGSETAQWILNEFLASPDVHVSNPEHFREILQGWSEDPCHKHDG